MNFSGLYQFIMPKLEQDLSPALVYHDAAHTQSVLKTTIFLANEEQLDEESKELLKSAALLHDTGFLFNHQDHEASSCNMAKKHLPKLGYAKEQIQRICNLILSTKIPHTILDPLGGYLCDADLYYLGGNEYEQVSQNLYEEMLSLGKAMSETDWLDIQIDFLKQHKYFTQTAITNQEQGKQANLAKLVAKKL